MKVTFSSETSIDDEIDGTYQPAKILESLRCLP
jgi:hypothetical protein